MTKTLQGKRLIPVAWESAPPAGCTLTPPKLGVRIEEWNRLSGNLISIDKAPERLTLRFRRDSESDEALRLLVDSERQCCSSLRFQISTASDSLVLEISGPYRSTPWAGLIGSPQSPPAWRDVHEYVQRKYGALAAEAKHEAGAAGCCDTATGCCGAYYDGEELSARGGLHKPLALGCGNAIAAAELRTGETVLDLGSGAGLELVLASRRVGPSGKVFGLDMTDEMLERAAENIGAAGAENVHLLRGYIEDIPLPGHSVDVIISNCVINLSPHKEAVFREIFRVLRPGGRFVLFDVVTEGTPDASHRSDLEAWAGCLAGAITADEYLRGLAKAGFTKVDSRRSHEVQPGLASVLISGQKRAV